MAPEDWTDWLSIATAVHNDWKNITTGLSPNQILLRLSPSLHYVTLLSLCFPLVPLVHLSAGHPTLPLHATIR